MELINHFVNYFNKTWERKKVAEKICICRKKKGVGYGGTKHKRDILLIIFIVYIYVLYRYTQ